MAARQEARRNFDENRRVGIDTSMKINQAVEVANILRHNLVQGSREKDDEQAKWGKLKAVDWNAGSDMLTTTRTPDP